MIGKFILVALPLALVVSGCSGSSDNPTTDAGAKHGVIDKGGAAAGGVKGKGPQGFSAAGMKAPSGPSPLGTKAGP